MYNAGSDGQERILMKRHVRISAAPHDGELRNFNDANRTAPQLLEGSSIADETDERGK